MRRLGKKNALAHNANFSCTTSFLRLRMDKNFAWDKSRDKVEQWLEINRDIFNGTCHLYNLSSNKKQSDKRSSLFHPSNFRRDSKRKLSDGSVFRMFTNSIIWHYEIVTYERPNGTVDIEWKETEL